MAFHKHKVKLKIIWNRKNSKKKKLRAPVNVNRLIESKLITVK